MADLVEQTPEAAAWLAHTLDAQGARAAFGRFRPAVIWTDARHPNGEPLLALDPVALAAQINADPYPLQVEHDPGRPMGAIVAAEAFTSPAGERFIAAVLGFYDGAPRLAFRDLGFDATAPFAPPKRLPTLQADFGVTLAVDPREVTAAWLDDALQGASFPVEFDKRSYNAAEAPHQFVSVVLAFALLVWNPLSKAFIEAAGKDAYANSHAPFVTALTGELVERTFLFLGFSFTDPNLDYVLARVRSRFEKNQRQHFCITKTRSKLPGETEDEFAYAKVRQELVTQDLLRFNIKTVAVEEYSEVTELLRTVANRFRQRTVFISGSAADYAPWGQTATENFLVRLSAALIDRDCRITSGFGLGIGSAVVTGAVEQIYSTIQRSIDSHLLLRPFPEGIQDPAERQKVFSRYRDELVSNAGIAIFVMGNKSDADTVVGAAGMRAEFDLAKEKGLHRLPIGASGSVAAELWAEMMSDLKGQFPDRDGGFYALFEQLGRATSNPLEVLDPLLKIVDHLRKE